MAYGMSWKPWLDSFKNRNEYVIYKAIEKVNLERQERGDRPITLKQAQGMRNEIIERMKSDSSVKEFVSGFEDDVIKASDEGRVFMSVMGDGVFRNAFKGRADEATLNEQEVRSSARRQAFISAINDVTGADITEQTYGQLLNIYRNYKDRDGNRLIPISPYENHIASRKAAQSAPGKLLAVYESNLMSDGRLSYSSVYEPTEVTQQSSFYSVDTPSRDKWLSNDGYVREVGEVYDIEDRLGISAMKPYMTSDDYDKMVASVTKTYSQSGQMHKIGDVAKSVDFLRQMNESGYDYDIKVKRHGEICASLKGSFGGADITVMPSYDSNFDSNFGKVYKNGITYRYTTNRKVDNKMKIYTPSVEDAMNLVRYSTGQTVLGDDGRALGSVGTVVKTYKGKNTNYNTAYYTNDGSTVRYKPFERYYDVSIKADSSNVRPKTMYFGGKREDGSVIEPSESAEAYLREAIDTARSNYTEQMNLETLISEAEAHKNDEDYVFNFSKDDAIAMKQQVYWDALTSDEPVKIPVVGTEDYEFDDTVETVYYEGSPSEQVRAHFRDSLEDAVGSYEPDTDGKRFNPVGVSTYMDSPSTIIRNNDNVLVAMQLLNIKPDELKGSDYYNKVVKNRLLEYDDTKAKPMYGHGSEFIRNMGDEIKQTLESSGYIINDNDIKIDDNGIVQYKARKVTGQTAGNNASKPEYKTQDVTGYIGQIFEPDGYGTVTTKFGDGDNYMFVPGYTASVLPQKVGENKTFEERTRLKGYEQHMREAIRNQLRDDAHIRFANYAGAPLGATTTLNGVYRQLYDVRHPVDYIERTIQEGMSEDFYKAVIETEARRVRYDSSFKDGATLNASYQASLYASRQIDDMNMNPLTLTDGRNMAIMSEEGDGYFDPDATSTGMNQGITRYLVEGAKVNPDGSIVRSSLDDKTPLCKHPVMKWSEYVPFDRRQMVFNNAIKAQRITDKVKTAQMTFGGWNFDDGFIVTKQFAETYKVRGKNDELRDIIVGDKILDKNGNKGVISLVIDPDMPIEEAREKGLENVLEWAKANPDVQVYGAPYPAVSRFNGGTARELMENPSDLKTPDGQLLEGCVGEAEFIVTHMTVDEKTHIYDDKEYEDGNGRRASAQLAWALDSKDATAIKREFYSNNDKAFTNMREYMISTGFDLSETGQIMNGYTPHEGEVRNVFTMPEMPDDGFDKKSIRENTQSFIKEIGSQGGFLELPFPLKFPNGDNIPMVQIDIDESFDIEKTTDVNYNKESWVVNRNGKEVVYHRNKDLLEGGSKRTNTVTIKEQDGIYAMPVMSSYLRSGQEYEDGSVSVHDYTNSYSQIYASAQEYLNAKAKGDEIGMRAARESAQRQFDSITGDIVHRKFESKYNAFKEELMSNRLRDSATAVWTADPRLDIDSIAVSKQMADSLGLSDDDHVMTWRDPILRDAGVRYMKVSIDENISGVAINPVMDKGYDGDFDGDSIAIVKLQTEAAKQEALDKFSVKSNLLDYGSQNEDGTYDLMLNHGLDLKTAEFKRPELKDRYSEITKNVNDFERDFRDGKITAEELDEKRTKAVEDLNSYVHDVFESGAGEAVISYKDMASHIKSCEEVVISGAKGSYGKLEDYANYLGASYEREDVGEEEPRINPDSVKDLGAPFGGDKLAAREATKAVEYATSVKTSVGVAGKTSQRGMKGCRNECAKAVLETTYPVTQGLLQAKHDPVDARQKYATIMSATRDLWRGYKLNLVKADMLDEKGHKILDENGDVKQTEVYERVYQKDNKGNLVYENGKPVPERATKDEFIKQMVDIYTRKDMLNVSINPDYVRDVANAMVDDDGRMRNIEESDIGSPMDRLAYKNPDVSSVDLLKEMAENGNSIYEGRYNQGFMPRSVYRNVQREFRNTNYVNHEYESLQTLSKSDTKDKTKSAKRPYNQNDVDYIKSKFIEPNKKRAVPDTPTETPFSGDKGDGESEP